MADARVMRADDARSPPTSASSPLPQASGAQASPSRIISDESLLAEIIENNRDGVLAFDTNCRYTVWNAEMERISGVPRAKVIGGVAFEVFPFLKEIGEDQCFYRALAGEPCTSTERPFHVPETGRQGFFEALYSPLMRDNKIVGAAGFLRDVTEEKRTREALRDSDQRLRLAMEAGRMSTWDWHIQTDQVRWSPGLDAAPTSATCTFAGTFETFISDIHPADRDRIVQRLRESLESSSDNHHQIEYRLLRPDGTVRWVEGRGIVFRDPRTHRATRVVGVCMDITERKRIEDALRLSVAEERKANEALHLYRQIFQHSNDGVAIIDPSGRYLEQNAAHQRLTGYSDEDLHGKTPAIHLGEDVYKNIGHALERHGAWRGEAISHTKSGKDVPIELSSFAVRDEAGDPVCFVGVKRDITQQKRVEEALREEARITDTLRSIGIALAGELDLDRLVQAITDAGTGITGAEFGAFFYNLIDERGESYRLSSLSGAQRAAFEKFPLPRNTALFGPTFRGERTIRIHDVLRDSRYGKSEPHRGMPTGHLPVRSYLAVPVRSRSGEVLGGLFFGHSTPGIFMPRDERVIEGLAAQAAVAIDNARLFETARQARHQAEEANNAKDQFLAVLSHELRTPLTPVLATVSSLEQDGTLPPDVQDDIKLIRRNVELEARLIDDLLDLTRISRGKLELFFEPIDIHDKIQHVVKICQSDIAAKRLHLALELDAQRHDVIADPARLQQVLWNLLKNAVKFTPDEGRITIRTRDGEQGRLVLEIVDNGIGIDPEVMPRIFSAFEQGGREVTRLFGGLGLGLAISKALTDLHHGELTARSEGRGRGATFTLSLPMAPSVWGGRDAVPSKSGTDAQRREETAPCRILLVEDHVDTSRVMARLLERDGYSVQTATTVAAALNAVERSPKPFDVLISDIGLPDGSGLELMQQLLKKSPIKGIALSGFGMEHDVQRSRAAGFSEHLTKPVNMSRLQTAINKLVESAS